jgi:hypothetical protein
MRLGSTMSRDNGLLLLPLGEGWGVTVSRKEQRPLTRIAPDDASHRRGDPTSPRRGEVSHRFHQKLFRFRTRLRQIRYRKFQTATSSHARDATAPGRCDQPSKKQRAQGMPGASACTHGPVYKGKKYTSINSPQVKPNHRHSLRDGLRLIPRSLRRLGFLSPSPQRSDSSSRSSRQRRGAKTTRLRRPRHDAFVWCITRVHRIPRPTLLTFAKRPSLSGTGRANKCQ